MGYSCVTTVLSPAAKSDLTDLLTVRDELSIKATDTSNDTWLGRAITQVSAAIQVHCKRVFAPQLVQDMIDVEQDAYPYQTPGGFRALQLSAWPVLAVVSVSQILSAGATQNLVDGVDFRQDARTGELLRLNPFTGVVTNWEAMPVTVVYVAGYGAMVTEAATVPASTPWRVSVAQAASWSCDRSVAYASGALLAPVAGNPSHGQYTAAAGVYVFNTADAGLVVTFTYATAAIPPDLVDICLQLVTGRFKARGRDPALIQRETPGVGTERYWFGGAPGQTGQFPPDIQAALDDYRVPTLA